MSSSQIANSIIRSQTYSASTDASSTILTTDGQPAILVYNTPRKFTPESELFSYLAKKFPKEYENDQKEYTLSEDASCKQLPPVCENFLSSPSALTTANDNCDTNLSVGLSETLGGQSLNLSRQCPPLSTATFRLLPFSPNAVSNLNNYSVQNGRRNLVRQVSAERPTSLNSLNPTHRLSAMVPGSDRTVMSAECTSPIVSLAAKVPPANNAMMASLPAWASPMAKAVQARIDPDVPFDIEASYRVKPDFLKVLRAVEGVNQTQVIFPYREITAILSKYIVNNKDRFFDGRNFRVALVENDLLGKAFGMKAFARSQVTGLMRAQLLPVEPVVNNSAVKVEPTSSAPPSVIKTEPDVASKSVSSHLRSNVRHRISVMINEDSSDVESVYSWQGYETVLIIDSDTSGDESSSNERVGANAVESSADADDDDDDRVYQVEYEIDDGSDDSDDDVRDEDKSAKNRLRDDSADDSDIEDVLIASAVTGLLNDSNDNFDIDVWADSEASLSASVSDDFALSNYDPELPNGADVWKCLTCGQPNAPFIRFCHQCWEERKGWVAERVNPRRRKKSKKTKGIPVKKSASDNRGLGQSTSGTAACRDRPVLNRSKSHPPMSISSCSLEVLKEGEGLEKSEAALSGSQGSCDSGFSQGGFSQESISPEDYQDSEDSCSDKEDVIVSSRKRIADEISEEASKRQKVLADEAMAQRRDELPAAVERAKSFSKVSCLGFNKDDELASQSSSTGSSGSNGSLLCNMCCVRPKDACFIHGQISHQVCCYRCAKMILKRKGPCPVCRRKIEKITRNIVV